jgi:hypothetical protein
VRRGIKTGRFFTDFLQSLPPGRGDLLGAVFSDRRRHQSSEQGLDAPIDVVVDRAAGLPASPVVRLRVRKRLPGARRARSGSAVLHAGQDGSGHGLLAKFLGQLADLGFGVAAVATEGLQEG